jgi:hypothetical protein
VRVRRHIGDPDRLGVGQNPARHAGTWGEAGALGRSAEWRKPLGIIEVPEPGRYELATTVVRQQVGVPDRPAGVGANPVKAELHRLLDAGGLVSRDCDRLQELHEPGLPVQRAFCPLAFGDVAPRTHDLDRVASFVPAQAQLVAHPAIRSVPVAEPVFVGVAAELKQAGKFGQDTGKIVGVDPLQPEARVPQVLLRLVAEQAPDVLADERRRIVTLRFEAVEHGRGRGQEVG